MAPQPPIADQKPHQLADGRVDEYFWIRDDSRSDARVLDLLKKENAYTEQMMAPVQPLQKTLFDEISNRLTSEDASVPVLRHNHWYHYEYRQGGEYPVYLRAHQDSRQSAEVMLDVNEMSKGHEYYQVANWVVTPDERLIAYAEDTVSRRQYTIRIKDLDTGALLPDIVTNVSPAMAFSNDGKVLFYVAKDPQTLLPNKVYRHRLGTPVSEDVIVYAEPDPTYYLSLRKSRSDQYIVITASATDSTEIRLLPANEPAAPLLVVQPREAGHEYRIRDAGEKFFVLSNWQAPNFRLFSVHRNEVSDRSQWSELVAHRPEVLIEDIEVFASHIVLAERENGLVKMVVRQRDSDGLTGEPQVIEFPDPTYSVRLMANPRMDQGFVRYEYSSLVRPDSVFDYSFATNESTLRKQAVVKGQFDHRRYTSERLTFTARDGVSVPVSLVYHKERFAKGTNPGYLYAYGSYGYSTEAAFQSKRVSLLDRGFVFAIIHVRGGQELGRAWYEDGRLLNKKNTFNDFVDGTKYLVDQGYVASDKVFAMGGSAGGLLMGAVINQAPELYRGVVAKVPFVDVVTTMMDSTIPLTTGEYSEWGNPADEVYYKYMLSYSPYDQVRAQHYPNLLVTTGLHDSQVQYFEPVKWVSRLRRVKTDTNRLLLSVNMSTGHGGASGRYERHRTDALEYAFLLDLLQNHDG